MAVTPFQLIEPFSMDSFNSRISEINTMFGGLGNEYLWHKTKSSEEIIQSGSEKSYFVNASTEVQYSSEVYIDNGTIKLQNPVTTTFGALGASLVGKYFYANFDSYAIRFCTSINSGSSSIECYYKELSISEVTLNFGYVNSPDPNAYPPAVPDGYTYTALGQLGNKVKIELISYVGTNTYGENNPTILTFDFKPKFLWFVGQGLVSGDQPFSPAVPSGNFYTWFATENTPTTPTNRVGFGNPNNIQGWMSADGKTLTWFNYSTSNASDQLNSSNARYYYIAIG